TVRARTLPPHPRPARRSSDLTAPSPTARVLAVFDAYADHARLSYEHGFRGCGLLNAAAELPAGSPGREAVREHKEEVEALLAQHLEPLAPHIAVTAQDLAYLLEGAISRAGLEGTPERLLHARRRAAELLA